MTVHPSNVDAIKVQYSMGVWHGPTSARDQGLFPTGVGAPATKGALRCGYLFSTHAALIAYFATCTFILKIAHPIKMREVEIQSLRVKTSIPAQNIHRFRLLGYS